MIVEDPAVVGLRDSRRPGLLLVRVTGKPPAGAGWPRLRLPCTSRFLPMVTLETESPGAFTVAVTDWSEAAGALNPGGTLTDNTVLPEPAGWNCVVVLFEPPPIVTGEVVIVPTLVFEIVTVTLAVVPPATG